jgi:hypothetical protein
LPGERGLKQRLGLHAIAQGGKGAQAHQERETPSESLFRHTPPPVSAYRVNPA